MQSVSVIIITKNEAANIQACINSARLVSNDIIVIDSGSTDDTVRIAQDGGANIVLIKWTGFGNARNIGAQNAKNDWILAVDADERVTPQLEAALKHLGQPDINTIYGFSRQSYFLGKKIRFGEWGRNKVYRLYNRKTVEWDLTPVHENLIGEINQKQILGGYLEHYTVITKQQDREKNYRYAKLYAQKFNQEGKKATWVKRFLSPVFNFVQTYFLRLGFLDGKEGFFIAQSTTRYVWLKYKYLHLLNKGKQI